MPYFVYNDYSPSQAPWRQSPMFVVAWAVIGGTLLGWGMRFSVALWLWVIIGCALALAAALTYWRTKGRHFVSAALATLSMVAMSAAWMGQSVKLLQADWPEKTADWIVEVGEVHKVDSALLTMDAKIVMGQDRGFSHKKVRLSFSIPPTSSIPSLMPGDLLRLHTRIRPCSQPANPGNFDYGEYLLAHGISGTAYVPSGKWQQLPDEARQRLAQGSAFSAFRSYLLRVRGHLISIYRQYMPQQADLAIMAALTLGDKSLLDAATRQAFSSTGTSHVLALSGLHLSILFAVLNALLVFPLKRRSVWRMVMSALVVIVLWLFVLLAGTPLSLLRAASMLSLMQVGIGLRRHRNATLNNLCIAACVLLIADPLSVLDAGFQLSFSAVLAIILAQQFVWSHLRLPLWEVPLWVEIFHWKKAKGVTWREHWKSNARPLLSYNAQKHTYLFVRNQLIPFITVSLSAQWGTLPFTLHYFHLFTPYAWIANFVAIPAVSLLLSASLVFFLIPIDIVRVWVAQFIQLVLHTMQHLLTAISHWWGAEIPIYVNGLTASLLVVLPTLIIIYLRLRRHRQRTLIAVLFAALLLVAASLEVWQRRGMNVRPQICVYKVPRTTVLHLVESAEASVLYSSADSAQTRQRLAYLYRDYFNPHHFRNISIHSFSSSSPSPQSTHVSNASRAFVFRGKSIVVIDLYKPFVCTPSHHPSSQRIDILVLSRASGAPLTPLLQTYAPRQVILSSALSARLRHRYAQECERAHIPYHDVGEAGAFVWEM